MKSRVEGADLDRGRQQARRQFDDVQIVGLMQWRERRETAKLVEGRTIEDDGSGEGLPAMHDPMAHNADPIDQPTLAKLGECRFHSVVERHRTRAKGLFEIGLFGAADFQSGLMTKLRDAALEQQRELASVTVDGEFQAG